jgi:hypothetical protein
MIGQTVGNYRLTRLLGEGGMGAVYLAEHPRIGRQAAVKILHAELARSEELVQRFFNEALAANAIRHPGIVEIFDSGNLTGGGAYIVMELLEGESVAARLRRGPIPLALAVQVAQQVAAALAAAHAKGIVHRDLKPDNLFLVPVPERPGAEMVKVLDFGIAKLGQGPTGSGGVRTRTGAVMGTPLYMSPEQCRGTREIDFRTDIYSLGVILYEMLCGQPPFISEGFGELAHLHISVRPRRPSAHVASIPEVVERIVLKALEKDPLARFQSFTEFQQALDTVPPELLTAPVGGAPGATAKTAVLAHTTLAGSATNLERQLTQGRRRRWGPWLLGGGTLAAAAVALATLRSPGEGGKIPAPPPLVDPSATPAAVAQKSAPPQPRTIAIKIDSSPSGARVVRDKDGATIATTPFEESWPLGQGVEKLRLELEGYRPAELLVPLDRGVALTARLQVLEAAATAARRRSPIHAPPRPAAAPVVQTSPPPAPAAAKKSSYDEM